MILLGNAAEEVGKRMHSIRMFTASEKVREMEFQLEGFVDKIEAAVLEDMGLGAEYLHVKAVFAEIRENE